MSESPSQAEQRASARPAELAVESSAGSVPDALEPSPFACPDQNRAKQSKALLGLAVMLATSLSFYVYHHVDAFVARAAVEHQAHYAPAEDSSLHDTH